MPSWNIHLGIAKRIGEQFNFSKNAFYVGNLIADFRLGSNTDRDDLHYDNYVCDKCPSERLPNLNEFLSCYKDKLKDNDLLMGYYVHLIADYYFNDYVFSNCWIQKNGELVGIKLLNKNLMIKDNFFKYAKKYKHHDFDLYGKYLFNNNLVELPSYEENINNLLGDLKIHFCTKDNLIERINYLNNEFIKESKYTLGEKLFGIKYEMLSQEIIEQIYNNCILYIIDEINKII